MSTPLFILAFCLVALLVYMTRWSGRVRVERSRIVDAPADQIHARVADLRRWPEWNPWGGESPSAEAPHSEPSAGNGGPCRWLRGDVEGGSVEHLRVRGRDRIEQRLRLRRPFPVRAKLLWRLAELEGKTRVTCTLRGRVGFSMRAFAATVQGALALDLRYGLDRLARGVERGDPARYDVTCEGVRDVDAVRHVYLEHTGALEGIGPAMGRARVELGEALAARGVAAAGEPIVIYLSTHARERTTRCRFAIPIGDAIVEGMGVATLPAHRAFVATLRGPREHLELAWYLAMQRLDGAGVRPDLRVTPSERHLRGSPGGHGSDDVTELRIPVLAR